MDKDLNEFFNFIEDILSEPNIKYLKISYMPDNTYNTKPKERADEIEHRFSQAWDQVQNSLKEEEKTKFIKKLYNFLDLAVETRESIERLHE